MIHVLILALATGTGALSPPTGEEIIRAMHDRYAGKWYENLALVQTVKYYDAGSGAFDSARVWYESIQLPGVVRSDIAPVDAGDSQLFKDDTWFVLEADSLVSERPGGHPVLLLGFDVYVQPVEETIARLERFDLSQVREDEWQDRDVYVVGGEARQFWIDKRDLLLVRLLVRNQSTGGEREVRFNAYEPLGGGWIATELAFMRDGRVDIHERYDYWTIDVEFEESLFATSERTRPMWVRN
jgi:hypothetical protein